MPLIHTPSFELAVYMRGKQDAEKLALILPGKLDTKDYPHMHSHVKYLADKSYLALSFDPPGTWDSPGGIKLYTMTNYLKAINELIEHFGNRPTLLMGHSRGGTMAMYAGAQDTVVTDIVAVMSSAGSSEISEKDRQRGFHTSYRDTPSGGKKRFDLPLHYYEDQSLYDVLTPLSQCRKPKLFICGNKDDVVTPEEVKDTYKHASNPKQLYELNSDHDYRRHPKLIEKVNRVVGEFIHKN